LNQLQTDLFTVESAGQKGNLLEKISADNPKQKQNPPIPDGRGFLFLHKKMAFSSQK